MYWFNNYLFSFLPQTWLDKSVLHLEYHIWERVSFNLPQWATIKGQVWLYTWIQYLQRPPRKTGVREGKEDHLLADQKPQQILETSKRNSSEFIGTTSEVWWRDFLEFGLLISGEKNKLQSILKSPVKIPHKNFKISVSSVTFVVS